MLFKVTPFEDSHARKRCRKVLVIARDDGGCCLVERQSSNTSSCRINVLRSKERLRNAYPYLTRLVDPLNVWIGCW